MPLLKLASLFQQATSTRSRATVLNPLVWLILVLTVAWVSALQVGAPSWATAIIFGIFVIAALLFFVAYIFCLFKNPDLLRTEIYSIQKMAIEKGFVGDNIAGIFQPDQSIIQLTDDSQKTLTKGEQ